MRYVLFAALLLAGCSSQVPNFILAPQVYPVASNQLSQARFAFAVSDERGIAYTLRLKDGDKVKQIMTSNDVRSQLEQTLSQALTEQGAVLDINSNTQMTVKIAQLQALVVYIQNAQGTFSKTYSGDSSFTAPFKMDVAAVERELRLLTEQVLTQLLQDNSWQQAVRG